MFAQKQTRAALLLTAAFSLLYAVTRTWLFSYDGLIDAIALERGVVSELFHPNHVLYPALAGLIYHVLALGEHGVRALSMMQVVNALVAGAAIGVFFLILDRDLGWRRALIGTMVLGVSHGFWTEAVDPGGYAWATLATCVFLGALVRGDSVPAFRLGLIHGVAVAAHQLLILAVPAVLMKRGWQASKAYFAGLGLSVGGCYLILIGLFHNGSLREAVHWVLSPPGLPAGGGVQFLYWWNFSVLANGLALWRGLVHSVVAYPATLSGAWVESAIVASVGLFILWKSVSHMKRKPLVGDTLVALWVWILVMSVFLFFYMPGTLRFRLLFLPALIYLALRVVPCYTRRWIQGLCALAILGLATVNYTQVIGPQSEAAKNPNLMRSLWVSRQLQPDDVFLFSGGTTDSIINVYILYFAPQVHARSFQGYFFEHPGGDFEALRQMVEEARKRRRQVYIEAALFNPITQKQLEEAGQVPAGTLQKWLSGLGLRRDGIGMSDGYGMYRIS